MKRATIAYCVTAVLLAAGLVAAGVAGLVYLSNAGRRVAFTICLLSYVVAALVAIGRSGRLRIVAGVFAATGMGYLVLTLATPQAEFISGWTLNQLYASMHVVEPPPDSIDFWVLDSLQQSGFGPSVPWTSSMTTDKFTFRTTGHSLYSMLAALLAAGATAWLTRKREPQTDG